MLTAKAQTAELMLIYAIVLWIVPAYVIGSLVTCMAYLVTAPPSRRRKLQVFGIHLLAGLAIGAALDSRSSLIRLVWIVGVTGAASGAVVAFATPDVATLE